MTALLNHGLVTILLLGMVSVLSSKSVPNFLNVRYNNTVKRVESNTGAILGRPVEIPARDYVLTFKVEAPKLGDCALKMEDGRIKTCTGKFGGNELFIPKAATNIDVSKIQNNEDIITHGMGGIGVNVGVLGVVGVGVKTNVAVTTQTSNKHLTLMSSYELQRGTLTLQNINPLTDISPDGELYLSEIEIGGNELLIVTMEFESTKKKSDVEVTLTIKILFITISAKMKYVHQTFKSASKTRVQFKSSWRPHTDSTYTSLEDAIKEVEKIEEMYSRGPTELTNMDINDPKGHNTYYFAAWNRSPFGEKMNMAALHNDLNVLNQQNIEAQAIIHRISELYKLVWSSEKWTEIKELNQTVSNINFQLDEGIGSYHKLSVNGRTQLRDVYGENKAPGYYTRQLKRIVGY